MALGAMVFALSLLARGVLAAKRYRSAPVDARVTVWAGFVGGNMGLTLAALFRGLRLRRRWSIRIGGGATFFFPVRFIPLAGNFLRRRPICCVATAVGLTACAGFRAIFRSYRTPDVSAAFSAGGDQTLGLTI
ncbi:hypothetical protein KCP73_05825 [Salmonella enterica subsp. enterica]|nr:hypothetical protein KCP73_05825 [Salmonella enterica subsp. enterica]